jgi:fructuronate reductase
MTRRPGIVHVGVGAFARAHLAWFTQAASGDPWGIVAFTGRSSTAAEALVAQDLRYTLVVRAADGDRAEPMDVIVDAHPGSDDAVWRRTLASPTTAIVTLTVTEQAYNDPAVPDRLVDGIRARIDAGGGPLTMMSLDNLRSNGVRLRDAVLAAADPDTAAWIERNVRFPNTMVDRITPATTPADIAAVGELPGAVPDDQIPVIAEPFAEWVIEDTFAADRPAWETAGARIVDDVEPYEQRKLLLLNGAHSLLAYLGLLLGHETVADAFGDPRCRTAVEQLWDEAAALLPLPDAEIRAARADLAERFANPRIRHTLRQVAADGSKKLRERLPVDRAGIGSIGPGAATVLAAWWLHLTTQQELVSDQRAPGSDASVPEVLAAVGIDAAAEEAVAAAVDRIRHEIEGVTR